MNQLEPKVNLFLKYKTSLSILEDLSKSIKSPDKEERDFALEEYEVY